MSVHPFFYASKSSFLPSRDNLFNVMNRGNAICMFVGIIFVSRDHFEVKHR